MKMLNPGILRQLIEKIEVRQIEGTVKNCIQRAIPHYRYVGCLQIPEWEKNGVDNYFNQYRRCRDSGSLQLFLRHEL